MKLCYTSPASCWQEGLPLGNGRLGAVVYSRQQEEMVFSLNEDTLWTGYPAEQETIYHRDDLIRAGELTREGRYEEAEELLAGPARTAGDVQTYTTPGEMVLRFFERWEAEDYRRALDLEKACLEETYRLHGRQIRTRTFISAPLSLMVFELTAAAPVTFSLSMQGGWLRECRYTGNTITGMGTLPGICGNTVGWTGHEEGLYVAKDPQHRGMDYVMEGRVWLDGGEAEPAQDCLILRDVKHVVLLGDIRTGYAGAERHPALQGADIRGLLEKDFASAGQAPDVERLFQEHAEEYQSFFGRVSLSLGKSGREDMDMSERLRLYQESPEDPPLQTLLFDYGRYLLISSSRPGTQPANLQGIWNPDRRPPWFSDYTVNINTEMNYWPAGPCCLPEMEEPLIRMCREMVPRAQETARNLFDSKGAAAFHNVDIWRRTVPANGLVSWSFWPFGFAWLCRNLYEHTLFTDDLKALEEILPILRENVLFCCGKLLEKDGDKPFIPATSPENAFQIGEKTLSVAAWTENTLAIVRNLLRDYLEACSRLGWSDEQKQADEAWKLAREHLAHIRGPVIGPDGRIQEWNEPFEEYDRQHRHLSHLYSLHPGRDMKLYGDAYLQAARRSLEVRGDDGSGWSMAWKILMWARLEDGARAGALAAHMLHLVDPKAKTAVKGGGVYPNLLCAHPPFQIDGNFGYTAGIAEMLLQSYGEEISVLPAVPPAWKEGRVLGLMARGSIRVDIIWNRDLNKDLKKTEVRLERTREGSRDVVVRMPSGKLHSLKLESGKPVTICD